MLEFERSLVQQHSWAQQHSQTIVLKPQEKLGTLGNPRKKTPICSLPFPLSHPTLLRMAKA
jgi:hypothetical protein